MKLSLITDLHSKIKRGLIKVNNYSPKSHRLLKRVRLDGPLHPRLKSRCWIYVTETGNSGYGPHRDSYNLFKGDIPAGMDVCHHCDNPGCIRPDHLFVGTRKDNMIDCTSKGRHKSITKPESVPKGDTHFSRLNPERLARGDRHGSRTKPEKLARGDRNGSRTHPERLARGDANYIHRHPEVTQGENNGMAQLTESQVLEIRLKYKPYINCRKPSNRRELALEYDVSVEIITCIVKRITWKHLK